MVGVLWPDVGVSFCPLASRTSVSSFGNQSARRKLAEMKETLALARVARDDVRAAYAQSMQRLEAARTELETISRRGALARQINDEETVSVAERFAESRRATIGVLERKIAVQYDELAMTERTVTEMEAELRLMTGRGPAPDVTPMPGDGTDADSLGADSPADPADFRALDDAARAQTADERLAELKRRMGRS